MSGLDDVLERLVTDHTFRGRLATDPAAALAGYDLSADDRELLASQVSTVAGTPGSVESRMSKASLAGFLDAAGEVAEGLGLSAENNDHAAFEDHINLESWAHGVPPASGGEMPTEDVRFYYQSVKFAYDRPDTGLPEALGSADSAGPEEPPGTGPISDVLYSAAGSSGPDGGAVGDPMAGGPGWQTSHDFGKTWVEQATSPEVLDDFEAFDYPGGFASPGSDPEPIIVDPMDLIVTSFQSGSSGDAPPSGDAIDDMVAGVGAGAEAGTNAGGQSILRPPPDVLVSSFQMGDSGAVPAGGTGIDLLIGGSTVTEAQPVGGDGADDLIVGPGSAARAGTSAGNEPINFVPPDVLVSGFQSGSSGGGSGDVLIGATGMDDGIAAAESVPAVAPAPEPETATAVEAAAPAQVQADAPEPAAPTPAPDRTAVAVEAPAEAVEPGNG